MLSRAQLGAREIVAGVALFRRHCPNRGRRSTLEMQLPKSWQAQHSVHLGVFCVAGAAFGSCLMGQDVVVRAARGARNRGRRSALETPLPKSWQAQHSVHLGAFCVAGAAFGSCLMGQNVVARAARGARNRSRRSTLETPWPKSWQAQRSVHLGVFCVAGAAFGSCLLGQDVVARAAWGAQTCGRRSTL